MNGNLACGEGEFVYRERTSVSIFLVANLIVFYFAPTDAHMPMTRIHVQLLDFILSFPPNTHIAFPFPVIQTLQHSECLTLRPVIQKARETWIASVLREKKCKFSRDMPPETNSNKGIECICEVYLSL